MTKANDKQRIEKALIEKRHGAFAESYARTVANKLDAETSIDLSADGDEIREAIRMAVLDGALREKELP